jgi:hypothetical protein
MTGEQILQMHQARPFRPFNIQLADGRAVPVEHAECLAITPAGRTIGVAQSDNTIEIIDLLLVTSLRPRPNGRHRRGRSS